MLLGWVARLFGRSRSGAGPAGLQVQPEPQSYVPPTERVADQPAHDAWIATAADPTLAVVAPELASVHNSPPLHGRRAAIELEPLSDATSELIAENDRRVKAEVRQRAELDDAVRRALRRIEEAPLPKPVPPPSATPAWLARLPPRVLFLDVETTGLSAADRIVSFAGIGLRTSLLADGKFDLGFVHLICNPQRKNHPLAQRVHGYDDWTLQHQVTIAEIADAIVTIIADADLIVAHNAGFDISFLERELTALGHPAITQPIYCTMDAHRRASTGSASLVSVAEQIGLQRVGQRHTALEDAWLAMMVYLSQHGCPHRIPYTAFGETTPLNLKVPPAKIDGADRSEGIDIDMALYGLMQRNASTPPWIGGGFVPSGLDLPDDDPPMPEVSDSSVDRDDLEGTTFAMEYADVRGIVTRRRVTLRELLRNQDGCLRLRCICHERRALRTFRLDRIRTIFDLDGVVHEPVAFFRDGLRVTLGGEVPSRASRRTPARSDATVGAVTDKPGLAQRAAARDGLRVLAALSRSDGMMHPVEAAKIVDYVVATAALRGIVTGDADRVALLAYVNRQRPTSDVLAECMGRLRESGAQERARLLTAAVAVVEADGLATAEELDMVTLLRRSLRDPPEQ